MKHIKSLLFSIAFIMITACGGGGGDADPTADAGPDQTVLISDTVTLSGSGTDAEGAVTYSWTQTSGTTVTLSDTTITNPTFSAPVITGTEVLVFALTVTDTGSNTDTDTVQITVNETDSPPTGSAGPDQTVATGSPVTLAGTGSDAEGAVTFSWSQTAGTTVTLSDTMITNPTFTAPAAPEVLTFRLTVTDSAGASVEDTVSISVTDTPAPLSYLFYTNSLNAVDPDSPTSPTLIEPTANLVQSLGGFSATAEVIRTGTVDIATKVVTDQHAYAVIYPKTDGKIYKVSALKSGSLTPVQVSNESQADEICTDVISDDASTSDLANVDNSQYIYVLPGVDALCRTDDDIWKMVRLNMGVADDPVIAKKAVSSLRGSSGEISGWLVHDAGELQKCDASFAGCTPVRAGISSVNKKLQASIDTMLLEIDDQLYIYDETTNALSTSLFTIPASTSSSPASSDGNMVYFGYGTSLYQLPADGSADATVLQTEASDIQRVEPGASMVVYQVGSGGLGTEVKSVAKAGGTAISLAAAIASDDLIIMFVKDTKVYYNIRTTTATPGSFSVIPVVAGVINENGTSETKTADAAWGGGTIKTTYDADIAISLGSLIDKVILVEGHEIAGTGGGYAGATVTAFDAATAVAGATLGTLPTVDNLFSLFCFGFGDDVLCGSLVVLDPPTALPPFQNDIFYLNAASAGSLVRVTNTTGENEINLF